MKSLATITLVVLALAYSLPVKRRFATNAELEQFLNNVSDSFKAEARSSWSLSVPVELKKGSKATVSFGLSEAMQFDAREENGHIFVDNPSRWKGLALIGFEDACGTEQLYRGRHSQGLLGNFDLQSKNVWIAKWPPMAEKVKIYAASEKKSNN